MTYQSDWRPSERLQRLAERRGAHIDAFAVSMHVEEIPLTDAIARLLETGGLSSRDLNTLRRHIHIYPEYDNDISCKRWNDDARAFLKKYPTNRAFLDGICRGDKEINDIRNAGPKTIAAWRRAFSGELH